MGPINSSFLLVLSKFLSGDNTWTLCFCFASHCRALCWLGLVLGSSRHSAQPQYTQQDQLAMFNRVEPHSAETIWPAFPLGISALALVVLKALHHAAQRHTWEQCVWTPIVSQPPESKGENKLPIITRSLNHVDTHTRAQEVSLPPPKAAVCYTPIGYTPIPVLVAHACWAEQPTRTRWDVTAVLRENGRGCKQLHRLLPLALADTLVAQHPSARVSARQRRCPSRAQHCDCWAALLGEMGKAAQHLATPRLLELVWLALLFLNLPFPQKCE